MAEEKDEVILKSILWQQKQQESLKEGFTITFMGEEFVFFPTYIDRNDKKMDRLLTGIISRNMHHKINATPNQHTYLIGKFHNMTFLIEVAI